MFLKHFHHLQDSIPVFGQSCTLPQHQSLIIAMLPLAYQWRIDPFVLGLIPSISVP
jgi:hypothetical protein